MLGAFRAPFLLLAFICCCVVVEGRKIVVSGHDGECEQMPDCQTCLYNGGICVWVVAQKMTSDYDYCGNFTRLHFRYGQSYLLYNMVWCSRIFEEDRKLLPGESEIAPVDQDGVAVVYFPVRAWIAIVLCSVFAIAGIAAGVWFWCRYNRLRIVQLESRSRAGSAAADAQLNSIRQRSSSRQSSRQGSRRNSGRALSPIREACAQNQVGPSQGAGRVVPKVSPPSHNVTGYDPSLGSDATGSMASVMQGIQPMALFSTVPSLQQPSYSSFSPFTARGYLGAGQNIPMSTLSRGSSQRSKGTCTSLDVDKDSKAVDDGCRSTLQRNNPDWNKLRWSAGTKQNDQGSSGATKGFNAVNQTDDDDLPVSISDLGASFL